MAKKDSILPVIALGGIGLVAIYALSQYGGSDDTTGTGGWGGGTGTRSLTPIVTETTETTVPIGGGEYPQIVLPSIPPYEQPALPEWLFAPPAPTVTTAPPPTPPAPTTKKEPEPSPFGAGGGFGGGGVGGRGGGEIITEPVKSGFSLLGLTSPFSLPLSMSKIVTSYIGGGGETKKADTVKLEDSWAGSVTGITAGGKTSPVTQTSGGSGGIPAEGIQSFFYAGKDYGAPAYTTPAPGGGTTYHYESGAYQTVQQGQIVSAGSAGSTTPPARYSGQYYAAPGTAAGGEKGRVYSKKAAQLAGLI